MEFSPSGALRHPAPMKSSRFGFEDPLAEIPRLYSAGCREPFDSKYQTATANKVVKNCKGIFALLLKVMGHDCSRKESSKLCRPKDLTAC